jgi:hypothetical protein
MAEKCAHPSCNCVVEKHGAFGKYCSDVCRMKGTITELRCECKHPACSEVPAAT